MTPIIWRDADVGDAEALAYLGAATFMATFAFDHPGQPMIEHLRQEHSAEYYAQALRDQFEVEVYGYGHLPLAYSARCFTARSENKPKDQCKKCCIHYLEGRAVDNLEGQRLFVLNGIQTMSGACLNLVNDMQSMTPSVDWFRISPQANGTIDLIQQLQTQLVTPKKVKLASTECNGYWHQIAGLSQV